MRRRRSPRPEFEPAEDVAARPARYPRRVTVPIPFAAVLVMAGRGRRFGGGVPKVYLQNGKNTLHAKTDTAGENLTIVGSDNYHPRRRYETELVLIIDDVATNAAIRADARYAAGCRVGCRAVT